MGIERLSVRTTRTTAPCDHYWLCRRGGACPTCGETFRENFGGPAPSAEAFYAVMGIDVAAVGRDILGRAEESGQRLDAEMRKLEAQFDDAINGVDEAGDRMTAAINKI